MLHLRPSYGRILCRLRPFALVWSFFYVVHLWLIGPLIQNGDGAVYNEQIETHLVNFRTTHVGYILLGIGANAVLPFDVERNMNLLNLAFASGGAVALLVIAKRLGASSTAALFASLLAFTIPAFLRGAVLAEVDVVACSLVLAAVAAWASGYRVPAGMAFGLAMLVTPISALSLPMLLLARIGASDGLRPRRTDLLNLLVFGLAALAIYVPFVAFFWHDYWYGGRGLLHAPREPWDVTRQIGRSFAFITAQCSSWFALGVGCAIGRALTGTSLGVGVLVAVVLTAVVGERFLDVPVQLPNACVILVFAVLLVDRIPDRKLALSTLSILWVLAAWPTYRAVDTEVRDKRELRATFQAMAAETPKMIGAGFSDVWDEGLPFERIVYHRTKLGLALDYRTLRASAAALVATKPDYAIWLLAEPPPGLMAPFAHGWHRENRVVRGHPYEVWLPNTNLHPANEGQPRQRP